VRLAGYLVGLCYQSQLVLGLDGARHLDGLFQDGQVLVVELEEGDILRHLGRYGEDGGLGHGRRGRAEVRERRIDVVGVLDFVHLPLLPRLFGADGEAGPYDALGIDGRDEEDRSGRVHVVEEVAVGQRAAGEVVEEPALSVSLLR